MNQSAIKVRYAKAFFSLAKEKNLLDTLKKDIELISKVCKQSTDFVLLLESPIVKTSKKTTLITSIFSEKIDKLTLKFLQLITKNKREIFIPSICQYFLELTREDQNIKSALLTTATKLDGAALKKIESILTEQLHAKIEFSNDVNPDIIGGMVIRIEDRQYDASVATQLKKIKQALLETELRNN